MEWRFRISAAYIWGDHDPTIPRDAEPATATRPSEEDGALSEDDEGPRREIDNRSRRISFLLGQAELKDTRIKELESALRVKSVDTLQRPQDSPPPGEAEDVRPAAIESELQTERDEQITSLRHDGAEKDKRLKELESSLEAKHTEFLEAAEQTTSLRHDGAEKDKRLKELESSLEEKRTQFVEAAQRITSLVQDGMEKDTRLKALEHSLEIEQTECLRREQRVASLLDECKAKSASIEQLESSLASEHSERLIVHRLYTSLRETIQVMVRIKPPLADPDGGRGAARWRIDSGSGMLEVETRNKPLKVKFDRVFQPQASNEDVFTEILPLVRQAATEGGRCVFIAHGASSTGKSYTMRGDDKGPTPTPGIIQLTGRRLFDMIPAGATVEVSSMFVYNGEVWDLLAPRKDKILNIPPTQKAYTPATKSVQVRSADELAARFDSTTSKTVKAATLLNAESSRGHYFFTIRVIGQPELSETGVLTFVDLAGNESVKESGASGQQFEESRSINAELFGLAEMIRNLRRGKPADSSRFKLTQLLAGAMGHGADTGARSETLMLSTVDLYGEQTQKSARTLEFAKSVIETPASRPKAKA